MRLAVIVVLFSVVLVPAAAPAAIVIVRDYEDIIPSAMNGTTERFWLSSTGGGITYDGEPTDLKVILFAYKIRDGITQLVGVLDYHHVSRFPKTSGRVLVETDTQPGLRDGETPDFFAAGVDLNRDGRIGTWDTVARVMNFDIGELFTPEEVTVTSLGTFVSCLGYQILNVAITPHDGQISPEVPEPASLTLLMLGAAGLLARRRRGR